MNKKIMSLESWCKELIYYNKSVAWIDKFGTNHKLWSKVPHQDENGDLVMVNNGKMSIMYYDWIRENKPELLEI
tara:strand:+ start:569 stop:790 length:222 start_codon:yes stop_codon:yes gene_type:complete